MKRLISALALTLAACSQPDAAPDPQPSNQTGAIAEPAPAAAADVVIADKSELYDFAYAWPAVAAAIPAVNADLEAEAKRLKAKGVKGAAADQQEARKNGWLYRQHSLSKRWMVKGGSAGLLSLGAEFEEYLGGAHGMQGFDARLVSRKLGRAIPFRELFVNPDRALTTMSGPFCETLDKQRAEKRGEPVKRGTDFETACPKIADQVIVPAGSGRFTTFLVQVAPYEAGPYAEGDYQVPVPVTAALLAEIRPEYREEFGLK
ncbi:PdaC/SigV domain-containing protein [Sphingomonas sp. ID0503]|uniref:PdaC/SigV domain-containing protein n=1 Tax=Sphingomonas sp. ID0503 TaxID=3399691 RepID=UPI003AFAA2C7